MPATTARLENVTGARFGTRGSYLLSRQQCEELGKRILGMCTTPSAQVRLFSSMGASTNFARGDAYMGSESGDASVELTVSGKDRRAVVTTTRLDDEGLKILVAEAETASKQWRGKPREPNLLGPQVYPEPPKLWFDEVVSTMTPEGRGKICSDALDATEAGDLSGAGDLGLSASSRAIINTAGLFGYTAGTYGGFSMTARTTDGQGSGWAWGGYEDWNRVDIKNVIHRAVDLAKRTQKHVAVEPGRYTVILEPSAIASLIEPINWVARYADQGYTVFGKDPRGTNKIGLKMIDERLAMDSNPWDTEAPTSTMGSYGDALEKVVWFTEGVLRELAYDRGYAKEKGREPNFPTGNLRLSYTGKTQTLEEMIANTKRGIWVNRFSNVGFMNYRTMLMTGTTRDGTFLIENGKITKAIKNFRFTESPFFVLNKLEAAGVPIRASSGVVAPRIKVRDFDFTSLTDAV